jgi:hypothetical protein
MASEFVSFADSGEKILFVRAPPHASAVISCARPSAPS